MNPVPFRLLITFCAVLLARYVVHHSHEPEAHKATTTDPMYLDPVDSLQYPLQRRDQGDTLANPDTIGTVSGSKNRLSAIRLGGGCGGLGLT